MSAAHFFRSAILLLLVLCSIGATAPDDDAAERPKRILTMYWRRPDPRSLEFERGLRSALEAGKSGPIEYYAEYLDTDLFQTEEESLMLREYFTRKYRARPVDAVIAEAGPVIDFLLLHRTELFPNTPILYFSARKRDDLPPAEVAGGFTGVVMRGAYRKTFELARRLQPDATTALVVMTADPLTMDAVRSELRGLDAGVQIDFVSGQPTPEVVKRVAALRSPAFVFYVRHTQEPPERVLTSTEGLRVVVKAAAVPVYAVSDPYVGEGIVGGEVYSSLGVGQRLGELAMRVADGERARDIAVEDAPLVPTVDWRALKRWHLDAGALPTGTVIRFRQPTAWDSYKWYVAAAVIALAVQSALIGTLLVTRARRRKVETTNRAMLRAMPDLVFLLSRDGVYLDYHVRDPKELLVKPEQFLGRNMREVLPPELAAAFAVAFERAKGDEVAIVEYSLPMPDGERHYEARIVASDESGMLAIVRDITDWARSQRSLGEQRAALDASDRHSRRLAGRLIAAQEMERKRIARDLHDDIGQQLTAVTLALRVVKDASPRPIVDAVDKALVRVQQLAEALRRLSHDLHPSALNAGLEPALRAYCSRFARLHGIDTEFTATPDLGEIEHETSLCLYRVTQEALGNISRHSGARRARVTLARDRDRLHLTITDDGRGFDVAKASSSAGLGLVSIDERVRLQQGTMQIESSEKTGTSLRIDVPAPVGAASR